MKESELIKDLQNGSKAAFNTLYSMYCKRLYAFCFQYTKSKEDTEEIVQDVFVKLWTHRDSIQTEEYDTCAYFLFRIMKNTIINRYKALVNSPIFEEYTKALHDKSLETNKTIEYEEFREVLASIIRNLPSTQQKVVDCRLFLELDTQETARRLELSEQTVRNQWSIALKTIRERLNKQKWIGVFFLFLYVIK